ncbi:MAG: gliding motility lipoprotein GldH [Ginsengibacter sp.]
MKQIAFVIIVCTCIVACAHLDVFEKTVAIPGQSWYYNNKPSFTFTITDTSAAYNIYVVLRHTDSYQYNNIWLSLGYKAPGDAVQFQNIDIILGTDKSGWKGNGMDDIFEVRKNITRGPLPFKKAGNYTFTISQIMRENPLKHILNIGVRAEKVRL